MVDFSSGALFQPVKIDLTSGFDFLQRQQQLVLERSRLELQKQQQEFDRDTELAHRTSVIAAREADALLKGEAVKSSEQTRQYRAEDRTVEKRLDDLKVAAQEADLKLRTTTDPLQAEKLRVQIEETKARTASLLSEVFVNEESLRFINGITGELGSNPNLGTKEYIDLFQGLANPGGRSFRSARSSTATHMGLTKEVLGLAVRGMVSDFGKLFSMESVKESDFEGLLSNYNRLPLEAQKTVADTLITQVGTVLSTFPDSEKELDELLVSVPNAESGAALLGELIGTVQSLDNIISVLGPVGEQDATTKGTFEKIQNTMSLLVKAIKVEAQTSAVVDGSIPISTSEELDNVRLGLDRIGRRASRRPMLSGITEFAESILAAGVWPESGDKVMSDALSGDPMAVYQAARLWETLKDKLSLDAQLDMMSQVDQKTQNRFDVVNAARRKFQDAERLLALSELEVERALAPTDGTPWEKRETSVEVLDKMRKNAADFYQLTEAVSASADTFLRESQLSLETQATLASGVVDKNNQFHEGIMGQDAIYRNPFGSRKIADVLDMSPEELKSTSGIAMTQDFLLTYNELLNPASGGLGLNQKSAMERAKKEILSRWGKPFIGKKGGVLGYRPIVFAKAAGWANMPPELADKIAKAQLIEDYADEMAAKGIRTDGVSVVAVRNEQGLYGYRVFAEDYEGNQFSFARGFMPDFSEEKLLQMSSEARHLAEVAGPESASTGWDSLTRSRGDSGFLTRKIGDFLTGLDSTPSAIANVPSALNEARWEYYNDLDSFLGEKAPHRVEKRKKQLERSRIKNLREGWLREGEAYMEWKEKIRSSPVTEKVLNFDPKIRRLYEKTYQENLNGWEEDPPFFWGDLLFGASSGPTYATKKAEEAVREYWIRNAPGMEEFP